MNISFLHYLIPIVVLIVSYSIGYFVLLKLKLNNILLSSFISTLTGLLLIVFLFSIVITNGVTVQLLFLIPTLVLIIYSFQHTKGKTKIFEKKYLKGLKNLFITYLLWCIILILITELNYIGDDLISYLYWDIYHYARMSDIIYLTGEENYLVNLNFNENFEGGTTPYHYFEIHLNALCSVIFNISSIWSYVITVPIILLTVASSLLFNIFKDLFKYSNTKVYILSILLLFVSGMLVLSDQFVLNKENHLTINIVEQLPTRILGIYIALVLSTYYLFKEKYVFSVITLMLLQITYFAMVPMVLFTALSGAVLLLVSKKINYKTYFIITISVICNTIAIFIFYKLTSVIPAYNVITIDYVLVLDNVFGKFNNFIKFILFTNATAFQYYFILTLPFLFLIIKNYKKINIKAMLILFIFFFLFIEGGVFITALLNRAHSEAWQPAVLSIHMGSTVILLWIFIFSLLKNIDKFKIVPSLILIICIYNLHTTISNNYTSKLDQLNLKRRVTRTFLDDVSKFLEKEETYNIGFVGFLRNDRDAKISKPLIWPVGNSLLHYNTKINLECIDDRLLVIDNICFRTTNYYSFYSKNKNMDKNDLLKEFLISNNIRYFVGVEQNQINSYLESHSVEILKDSHSGLFFREIKFNDD